MTLQSQSKRNLKIKYTIVFFILLITEVLIALFVHDNFVRPFIGDVLVVILIYAFVRIFIPKGFKLLPLYIFLFATCVEVLQYFHLVELLHVENITFLRVIMGSVFDARDLVCYGVGCAVLWGYQKIIYLS
ncbi:MAG TPA: DUF2809 domain-containing protein [Lachnospiraceae bacterium]|nr:DUF2809 domain-containing protein [Lachnospiraceae bacterium]